MTEAANPKYFREILKMQLTRNALLRESFAVAFMDCDDFKQINDDHGHAIGDAMLRAVVDTARRQIRGSDTIARLGGDEFALLLPSTTAESALVVVKRLQATLAEQKIDGQSTAVSVGLASFETTHLDVEGVIAQCDSLMYRAKRAGKGQIAHEYFAKTAGGEGPGT